jgi:cytochrome P450
MTDEQLRDEMMTLFIAGHETTSVTLSWAWYLLAGHPEVETKPLDELSSLLAGREAGVSDLHVLPYTEMLVKETMRLYPPAWVIGRQALNDFEVHGYRLPAGTNVLLVPWITHRDTRCRITTPCLPRFCVCSFVCRTAVAYLVGMQSPLCVYSSSKSL